MARRARVVELPLVPGAISDDTELAARLHTVDMDKARFRGNRAETIKGWTTFHASGMPSGIARGAHTWSDLSGNRIKAAASENAVVVWHLGSRLDIKPKLKDVWLAANSIAYNGTDGHVLFTWNVYTPATNTATEALHFLQVGDSITVSGFVEAAAGTIPLNGTHTIISVPSPTTFVVNVGTGTAISAHIPFTVTAAFRNGLATGSGDTVALKPTVYSMDNFGENLVFCRSDGTPVWYWQPASSYTNLISNGTFATLAGWTAGSGWAASGGAAVHTGDVGGSLTLPVDSFLTGGKTYEMSFDITTLQANVSQFLVRINGIDIFPPTLMTTAITTAANGQRTYTFRFVCPPNPLTLSITADSSSPTVNDDIAIDNVSISLLGIAHPINEAPQKNYALFVDGLRVLNVLGSVEHDGDFSPSLLRWSDSDNYREWVTDTDNIAGESPLGKGSIAMCGAHVGERNLILTDDAAYVATATRNGYAVQLIGQGCGAVGPRSLAVHNNRAFWASPKGFYAYDGAQVVLLDCPVKDRYVNKLSQYQENKTFAWLNVEYGEVWFAYAHTDVGTEISRYIIFNFIDQGNPWSFGSMNRTCMTRAGTFQHPTGIDLFGNVWSHETGTSMPGTDVVLPFIDTGFLTGQGADRWLGCRRYYCDIENQVGNIWFSITGRRSPQGENASQTVGPLVMVPDQQTVDFLISARQLKFRWESASNNTSWRLGIVGLEIVSDRERR